MKLAVGDVIVHDGKQKTVAVVLGRKVIRVQWFEGFTLYERYILISSVTRPFVVSVPANIVRSIGEYVYN